MGETSQVIAVGPESGLNTVLVVGLILAHVVILVFCLAVCMYRVRRSLDSDNPHSDQANLNIRAMAGLIGLLMAGWYLPQVAQAIRQYSTIFGITGSVNVADLIFTLLPPCLGIVVGCVLFKLRARIAGCLALPHRSESTHQQG